MITIKVDESGEGVEVNGMRLCDIAGDAGEDFAPECLCKQCPNFNECEALEEDGGCEDDGVVESKDQEPVNKVNKSDEEFMDEVAVKFLVMVFSDMSTKGVVEIYKASKSFIQGRDGLEGAALSKVAALAAVELLDYVRDAIYMKE